MGIREDALALAEEDRKAIEWVRKHGGLGAVEKRLMPEGMKWPCYEDGEPVRLGEQWEEDGFDESVTRIDSIEFADDGVRFENEYNEVFCRYGERVKRPAPKVLDADGAEIRVGDVLYSIETGDSVSVGSIEPGNPWFATTDGTLQHCAKLTHRAPVIAADGKPLHEGETVWVTRDSPCDAPLDKGDEVTVRHAHPKTICVEDEAGKLWTVYADHLSHVRPDSWEKLREDSELRPIDYCVMIGYPPSEEESTELIKNRDIVRRAKALAERGA